jgi:hypothetical protein
MAPKQADRWSTEWFQAHVLSEEMQVSRSETFAAIFVQRLRDAERYGETYWSIHKRTEPGWWPMKIPVPGWDPRSHQIRYVTPAFHELITARDYVAEPGRWPHRREHLVTREDLVRGWERFGPDQVDSIARDMYDHRWSVVCVTVAEESALRASAAQVGKGGVERYYRAGLTQVYDRLLDRTVEISEVDPSLQRSGDVSR